MINTLHVFSIVFLVIATILSINFVVMIYKNYDPLAAIICFLNGRHKPMSGYPPICGCCFKELP